LIMIVRLGATYGLMVIIKTFNAAILRNVNDEQTLFLVDP